MKTKICIVLLIALSVSAFAAEGNIYIGLISFGAGTNDLIKNNVRIPEDDRVGSFAVFNADQYGRFINILDNDYRYDEFDGTTKLYPALNTALDNLEQHAARLPADTDSIHVFLFSDGDNSPAAYSADRRNTLNAVRSRLAKININNKPVNLYSVEVQGDTRNYTRIGLTGRDNLRELSGWRDDRYFKLTNFSSGGDSTLRETLDRIAAPVNGTEGGEPKPVVLYFLLDSSRSLKDSNVIVEVKNAVRRAVERLFIKQPDDMTHIKGGTFTMGGANGEKGSLPEFECPAHLVTVNGFWMSANEITTGEWYRVMDSARKIPDGEYNVPMTDISWYDVIEYCNKRSEMEGLPAAYTFVGREPRLNLESAGYRLPTEAEWEYAARAGTSTPFSTGTNITTAQANYNGAEHTYDAAYSGRYVKKPLPVRSFPPNSLGLYDMNGNVREWVWDGYSDYTEEARTNPTGGADVMKLVRGGSWDDYAYQLRSAYRAKMHPDEYADYVGFRVVRSTLEYE